MRPRWGLDMFASVCPAEVVIDPAANNLHNAESDTSPEGHGANPPPACHANLCGRLGRVFPCPLLFPRLGSAVSSLAWERGRSRFHLGTNYGACSAWLPD